MSDTKFSKKYNIGLDIGVTSVGWAVTNDNNVLYKKNSKNMWGVRLFDEANKAEVARSFRTARRRLRRRKERINILNTLMYEDIINKDPNFIMKLKESSLVLSDKKYNDNKYNLFKEDNFNDAHFFHKYPTMYHLRMDLINNDEKKDIRFVYLAIHHILKYRGNFLYDGVEFKNDGTGIINKLENIIEWIENEYNLQSSFKTDEIISILKDNTIKKVEKKEKLIKSFNFDSTNKSMLTNLISSWFGYKFSISKIFNIEGVEKDSFSFADEIEQNLEEVLEGNYSILINMQDVYSWIVLQDVLNGEVYVSKAFINKFNKFHEDLELIKKVYKKYIPEKYNKMFKVENEKQKNYYLYTKNNSKCSKEELYKSIGEDLKEFKEYYDKEIQYIFNEIENKTFLDKINTTDNGAIPFQLHKQELIKIIDNQAKYYNSLKENKEKIISLLEFRIPYYVGPLNNNSKFAWLTKRSDEKIYPWNFEEVVDVNASAEEFILRMIKKCTYLVDEYVIPKNSILCTEYCVLNELNNIRINDKKISKETKKIIVEKLFKTTKKVSHKRFKEFLIQEQQYDNIETITGLAMTNEFMSSMSSYIDMKDVFGDISEVNYNMVEEIIRWITIFEDKKILKAKIIEKYNNITKEQLGKILKKRYSGWSNLSKKLLVGLKSYDNETVMDKLRNTNFNLMQIITKKEFGFDKKIQELMPKLNNGKIGYKDVSDLHGSPAIKRGIWQSVKVIEEIVEVMGCEPQNIYIEFARGEDKNKNRKDSRAQQLLKNYEKVEENIDDIKYFDFSVYKELKGKSKEKEFTEKLYLYFLQNGKCLYSGRKLDISNLSNYQVDHILPQSYIKDDSISNKALVISAENQNKKANLLLSNEIINSNRVWWMQLKKLGLMDDKKFHNLTRTEITENDEIRFINRQLVETRQITKHVTNLLVDAYPDTKIFSINANANSSFRKNYGIYKNRNLNDYHHAHDAYITCIIGNFADKNFKYSKKEFEYTEYLKKYKKEGSKYRSNYGMLMSMIRNRMSDEEISNIKKVILNYKDCFITRKLEELTGEFYNQTLYKKGKSDKLIKVKMDKPTDIYGGYSGENKAYYSIISYIDNKGKEEKKIVGIPVQIAYLVKNKKILLKDYFTDLGYNSCIILKEKILKYQTYLNEYNEQLMLVSDTECKMNKQLLVNEDVQRIVYLMNKSNLEEDLKLEVENKLDFVFEYLLEKMKNEYKTFGNIYSNICKNRKKYNCLSYEEKVDFIKGIIDLLNLGQGNLNKIGLGDRTGRMSGIEFTSKRLKNMKFIDTSVTGMYKRGYMINGMENCNSK